MAWCTTSLQCYTRSKMALGTSKVWSKEGGCNCMNVNENGTLDEDCNCLYMPYCDGASFSGFRTEPWKVVQPETPPWPSVCNSTEIKDKTLTFRWVAAEFPSSHQLLPSNP